METVQINLAVDNLAVKYIHSSFQNDQRFLCIVAGTHALHAMLVTPKSNSIHGTDHLAT